MVKRRISEEIITDINITPFTDVVLVLLIIFLIATPLLMLEGLKTDIPARNRQPATAQQTTLITVSITAAGAVTVNGQPCSISQLTALLQQLIRSNPDSVVSIGADPETLYDDVVKVVDSSRAAGIFKYVLQQ